MDEIIFYSALVLFFSSSLISKFLLQFRSREGGGAVKRKFSELALNVMVRMIAGKRYYGETVVDLEEAGRFREIVESSMALSGASNLLDFLQVLRWIGLKGVEKRMIGLVKERDLLLQGLIDEHRKKKGVFSESDVDGVETREEEDAG